MFYNFTIIEKSTNEEKTVEALNKVDAMKTAEALKIDGPVYHSPFGGPASALAFAVQIIRKAFTLYAGDNDTLFKISRDASRLNAMYSFFIPDEKNPSFEEYAYSKLVDVDVNLQDVVQAALLTIYETIPNVDTVSEVLDATYKALNTFIHGEKRGYNDGGHYSNLIQLVNGDIVRDTVPASRALNRALRGIYGGENDYITSVIAESLTNREKFSDEDIAVIVLRIDGYTYKETAAITGRDKKDVENTMKRVQTAVKKCARKFPSVMEGLRRVTTVKLPDGDSYKTLLKI